MISKKLALSAFCASIISQNAFAAEGHTVNYNYLSAGFAFDKNGPASDVQKELERVPLLKKEDYRIKTSSLGGYLNGSYGFDNNVFLEGRLQALSNRQMGFFAGVGYHFPLDERSDFYLLGGVSKPVFPSSIHITKKIQEFLPPSAGGSGKNPSFSGKKVTIHAGGKVNFVGDDIDSPEITIEEGGRTLSNEELQAKLNSAPKQSAKNDDSVKWDIHFKSKLAPSIEVGYRINLTEELGVRLAYRLTQDKLEIEHVIAAPGKNISMVEKDKGLSNEFSIGAHYHFTPQLAAEVGYTFTKLPKIETHHSKGSHLGTVGLRYAF